MYRHTAALQCSPFREVPCPCFGAAAVAWSAWSDLTRSCGAHEDHHRRQRVRRSDDRHAGVAEGPGRRGRVDGHRRGTPTGPGARSQGVFADRALRTEHRRYERLRGRRRLRRRRDHGRIPATAGDEPDGSPRQERGHHEGRDRPDRAELTRRDRHRRDESPGRDDVPCRGRERVPEGARDGDGGRPGFRAAPVLHRGGAGCVAARRRSDDARIARRRDGRSAEARDGRREAASRAGRPAHARPSLPADARRGRRDRRAAEEGERVLRAERVDHADGRGDRERHARRCSRSALGLRGSTGSTMSTSAYRRSSAAEGSRRSSSST